MTNIIPNLWDLFLEKKKVTNIIIHKHINSIKRIIFSNQTAQLQFHVITRNTKLLLQMDALFRQHGYLVARILEFIDKQEIIEVNYNDFPNITEVTEEQLEKHTDFQNKLLELIIDELNVLFLIVKLKMKTLKVDYDEDTKEIKITPPTRLRDIQRNLTEKLSIDDHEWNAVFGAHNFPRRGITFDFGDSSGIGEVLIEEIESNWNIFEDVWKNKFRVPLNMSAKDFFMVWECIKWLNISIPFSENDTELLIPQIGPGSEEIINYIFQILKFILPDLKHLTVVNSIPDVRKQFFHKLFKYGLGWKYTTANGTTYFHLACQFAGNHFIRILFETFFYRINDPGVFYEKEVKNRINLINAGLVTLRGNREFLVGYQPIKQETPIEMKNDFNIKILEKRHQITAPTVPKYNISTDGEIDLIIYSNNNVFLIEAKSFFGRNLSSNIQYASDQCTKYREWTNTPAFNTLLKKHNIQNFNRIFILILTNRQEERLYVKSNNSGFYFPIISFSLLPLLLLGYYTVHIPIKKIIPEDLKDEIIKILKNKFKEYKIIEAKATDYDKFRWTWSKYFYIILNSINLPNNFDFSTIEVFPFNSGYTIIDYKIENTGNWELSEEIPIWENDGFTFFLCTEIGDMKHSYVCKNCKSIWIYYFPEKEEMTGSIYNTLSKDICIKCKKKIANQKALDVIEIANKSTIPMVLIKKELWEYKIRGNTDIKKRLKTFRENTPFKDNSYD